MDFRDFMKPRPEPTPEEKEFRDWIKRNRQHFIEGEYTPGEIGMLARLVGFDPMLIYRELSSFNDAINGTCFENRAALMSYQFDGALKQFQKMKEEMAEKERLKARRRIGLDALWRRVTRYQSGRLPQRKKAA